MKFETNKYAIFAYLLEDGELDIADGEIRRVDSVSLDIDYENVIGPPTRKTIPLSAIIECFDETNIRNSGT